MNRHSRSDFFEVQPWDMVEKSINPPANPFQAGIFVIGQSGQATFSRSEALIEFF